LREVFN